MSSWRAGAGEKRDLARESSENAKAARGSAAAVTDEADRVRDQELQSRREAERISNKIDDLRNKPAAERPDFESQSALDHARQARESTQAGFRDEADIHSQQAVEDEVSHLRERHQDLTRQVREFAEKKEGLERQAAGDLQRAAELEGKAASFQKDAEDLGASADGQREFVLQGQREGEDLSGKVQDLKTRLFEEQPGSVSPFAQDHLQKAQELSQKGDVFDKEAADRAAEARTLEAQAEQHRAEGKHEDWSRAAESARAARNAEAEARPQRRGKQRRGRRPHPAGSRS